MKAQDYLNSISLDKSLCNAMEEFAEIESIDFYLWMLKHNPHKVRDRESIENLFHQYKYNPK